jgi:hypothetical protein
VLSRTFSTVDLADFLSLGACTRCFPVYIRRLIDVSNIQYDKVVAWVYQWLTNV